MMTTSSSRQSFLGAGSDRALADTVVGVVGLGGGGSHISQQAAHVGAEVFHLFDAQTIEETNLQRLVGGRWSDISRKRPKTEIAARLIRGVRKTARVHLHSGPWEAAADALRLCDVIFGCLDSFAGRNELERQARRYLIPYIDIGMDVHKVAGGFTVTGQVVTSVPGGPCLWCCGVLTDARLAEEAARYGDAGPRQQVVWSNGVLASTAIGQFIRLITPWTPEPPAALLEYDGNRGTIVVSSKTPFLPKACAHFSDRDDLGDPLCDARGVGIEAR